MSQIVVCDSVTIIDASHYECVGIHVVNFTGSINPPLDFVQAGQFMSGGFFTMFVLLGTVLMFRTIFKAIPKR